MPAPIIPWQPSSIPVELQTELNRRKVNRSFKYIGSQQANWNSNNGDGDWNTYRGPMTSWVRACSNGAGHPLTDPPRERYVLYSGKGFYKSYGFQSSTSNGASTQVIGYTPTGEPHIIENSLSSPSPTSKEGAGNWPIHVPPPEISRIEVTTQKELFRRVNIEWVCFSWKQLVYMTPYWLVPGLTCMIEWGWNHYNIESLVDLTDTKQMQDYWDNAYPLYTNNIIKSKGNYDVVYGIISNFNWSIEGNKILCSTEITSKDRLYSGIAKDYGLSVNNTSDTSDDESNTSGGFFKSLRDFTNNKSVIQSFKNLVSIVPVVQSSQANADILSDPEQAIWFDILNPLVTQMNGTNKDQLAMRAPWVYGFFAGRPSGPSTKDDSYVNNEKFGAPYANDFDKKIQDNDPSKFWINMGMVVALLNYFSATNSGAKNGNNMFEVDIQNAVISGHPNLISCDPAVLIPNAKAPKFFYGDVGLLDAAQKVAVSDEDFPYSYQLVKPLSITNSIPNQLLESTFYQHKVCYRNDLDEVINYNRNRYAKLLGSYSKIAPNNWSFPSTVSSITPLPTSPRGLFGTKLVADYSGLLSNIYISFESLKDIINDDNNSSYVDIYKAILQTLMNATDGFWDLTLFEVDGVMTITDKNYVGKQNTDMVYSFDYSDADSIIKSLKFRPVMSDAQATRTIFGKVNNPDAKYSYIDKNDLLDYKFKDAVIGTKEDKIQGDAKSALEARVTANQQHQDLVRQVQTINAQNDDGSLQMSLNANRNTPNGNANLVTGQPEIIKLVMPNQQLLRLILNDNDEENNSRYCAVQPNITLELTIQGLGGLRTFMYFIVRNLPEPYSDRDIIFRITDTHQTLESGTWETLIRAQPAPLTNYIKKNIRGPLSGNVPNNNGWPITTT